MQPQFAKRSTQPLRPESYRAIARRAMNGERLRALMREHKLNGERLRALMREHKLNGERLRALMREHKLTRAEVAEILSEASGERVSIDTVHAWLRPPGNRAHRNMPGAKLKLLELALKERANGRSRRGHGHPEVCPAGPSG